jgi:hypothetical protein
MDFENTNSFFLKLDTENGAHLIEDLDLEKIDLLSSLSPLETASIDGMLLKSFKSILHIPTYQDLVKIDIEMAKTLSKLLNVDKNTNINNIINKLLSIDFREQFIFSEKNLSIICNILIYAIGELKKFKVTTYMELEAKIKSINFSKYDFQDLVLDALGKGLGEGVQHIDYFFFFELYLYLNNFDYWYYLHLLYWMIHLMVEDYYYFH